MNGKRIKAWLIKKGIKQVEIARNQGISPATVNKFIIGRTVSAPLFRHFLSLGCPLSFFTGRPETMSKNKEQEKHEIL